MPTDVRQVRVAIITADSAARDVLLDALGELECAVTVVDSESVLLATTKEWGWHETVVVLLDVKSSPVDVPGLLARLKKQSRTISVLLAIIAGESERDAIAGYLEAGTADWLTKPFDSLLLRTRLKFYLEHAQAQNRLERVRQDVAIFRNEMTNPYASIKEYAETLLGGGAGALNDKQETWLSNILRSANFWVRVRDAFSQIVAIDTQTFRFHFTRVAITKVVQESLKLVNEEIHRGDFEDRRHSVAISIPADLPPVQADELRLIQVLVILVENANHYTPHQGRIVIAAEELLEAEAGGQRYVCISVEDNGIGIDPKYEDRIFQRFFRAAEVWETVGSGLHLYIARVLIEGMGGRIWYESAPGKGSVFYVSIPVAW